MPYRFQDFDAKTWFHFGSTSPRGVIPIGKNSVVFGSEANGTVAFGMLISKHLANLTGQVVPICYFGSVRQNISWESSFLVKFRKFRKSPLEWIAPLKVCVLSWVNMRLIFLMVGVAAYYSFAAVCFPLHVKPSTVKLVVCVVRGVWKFVPPSQVAARGINHTPMTKDRRN